MKFSDFIIQKSFTSTNGDCFIGISRIDGIKYFIKRIVDITYGSDSDPLELKKSYKLETDSWLSYHRRIRQSLNKLGNDASNIIFPLDFFVDEGYVYEVYYFHPILPISLDEINSLGENEKLRIMQISSYTLKLLHSANIIHFDLKPDNIIVEKSVLGGYISRIVACSDVLFDTFQDENNRPYQEKIVCTDSYWSPELALYKLGKKDAGKLISCKNDVFAMGLIFHEWWTGKFPNYEGRDDFISPYQIINDFWPNDIKVDSSVPAWLSMLIMDMLSPNPDNRPNMDTVFEAIKSRNYESLLSIQNKTGTEATVNLTSIIEENEKVSKRLEFDEFEELLYPVIDGSDDDTDVFDELQTIETDQPIIRNLLCEDISLLNMYVDLVLCIDVTVSMQPIINTVKRMVLSLYDDIVKVLYEKKRDLKNFRVKVIPFRDYYCDGQYAMDESRFFNLPDETSAFHEYVLGLKADGGGDGPESALEAIALAMKSDWVQAVSANEKARNIIVVITDASAHPFEKAQDGVTAFYPKNMLTSLQDLHDVWAGRDSLGQASVADLYRMDADAKRLIIYSPLDSYPWNEIAMMNCVMSCSIEPIFGGEELDKEAILVTL